MAELNQDTPTSVVPDLAAAVRRAAELWPDAPAWTFDPSGARFTFADVDRETDGYAGALAGRGIGAGDRVGVMLDNRPAFPLIWLALAKLGAAMVPLNPRYGSADLAQVLEIAQCALVIGDETPRPDVDVPDLRWLALSEFEEIHGDVGGAAVDLAVDPGVCLNVQFTSGTTGLPKGCLLSHQYWMTLAGSLVTEFPYLRPDDVMLTAQPFYYVDPQWNVAAALISGAHLVIADGFHPSRLLDTLNQYGVTYLYCLAAMPRLLLAQPPSPRDRDHELRVVQCSAIPADRHVELESRFGVKWYEAYGMTETGADLRVTEADHDELVGTGCLGRPVAHREARIVTWQGETAAAGVVGELWLRGPAMMSGYLDNPAATQAVFHDEWLRTGDLATMDSEGRVTLAGRLKDMVRRAGENISCQQVESLLESHPGVALAAVVAVPDQIRGEEALAVVVPSRDSAPASEPETLAAYLGSVLAQFKVPRYWQVRDALPMTASHRVRKPELRLCDAPTFDRTRNTWTEP